MKKIYIVTLIILLVSFMVLLVGSKKKNPNTTEKQTNVAQKIIDKVSPQESAVEADKVTVLTEGFDTPWGIAFLPEGGMLVTERKGTVRLVEASGKLQEEPVINISSVKERGEGGLLGIALHPEFNINSRTYVYYTYGERGSQTLNRVSYFTYRDKKLVNEKIVLDAIPSSGNHNGGRLRFGPDKYLYITTGDAENPSDAQDKNSLGGKILRVDSDGNAASGNPFSNRVYSFGHRNPQGIAWDKDGGLWESEHGPSGLETGNDEFNKIVSGKNYGWPEIKGTQTKEGMEVPVLESGRGNTWAPGGLAYLNDKFYFTGLRGSALYRVTLEGGKPKLDTLLKGEFGRLREVIVGPDNMLYVTTSNKDGRGVPKEGDDKILRINPEKL